LYHISIPCQIFVPGPKFEYGRITLLESYVDRTCSLLSTQSPLS
jgi:hypothetical protein